MMHRAFAAKSARTYANVVASAALGVKDMAAEAALAFLHKVGIYEQAMRENRRRTREFKRFNKSSNYCAVGLNGPRAMARRRRQIERGQLRAENGLVA